MWCHVTVLTITMHYVTLRSAMFLAKEAHTVLTWRVTVNLWQLRLLLYCCNYFKALKLNPLPQIPNALDFCHLWPGAVYNHRCKGSGWLEAIEKVRDCKQIKHPLLGCGQGSHSYNKHLKAMQVGLGTPLFIIFLFFSLPLQTEVEQEQWGGRTSMELKPMQENFSIEPTDRLPV